MQRAFVNACYVQGPDGASLRPLLLPAFEMRRGRLLMLAAAPSELIAYSAPSELIAHFHFAPSELMAHFAPSELMADLLERLAQSLEPAPSENVSYCH